MVRESSLVWPSFCAMSDCVTPSGPASSTTLYAWWRRSSRHLIYGVSGGECFFLFFLICFYFIYFFGLFF